MLRALSRIGGGKIVEPVSLTLGAIAAAIYAKAQDRAVEGAVGGAEGAARGFAAWLRARFFDNDLGQRALDDVAHTPKDRSAVDVLARVIDARAQYNDDTFGAELAALVEAVQHDGQVASFVTEVYGDARIGKIVNIGQARDVSL